MNDHDSIVLRDDRWWDESDPELCGLMYAGSKVPRERVVQPETMRCHYPKGHDGLHEDEVASGRFRLG